MIVTYQGVYRTFQTLERLSFGNGALQNEKIALSSSDNKFFVEPQKISVNRQKILFWENMFFAKEEHFFGQVRTFFLPSKNIFLSSDKNVFVARAL